MFAVEAMVEELVEHLQIVSVVSGGFQMVVFEIFPEESLPIGILEFGGNIVQNFLLFEG